LQESADAFPGGFDGSLGGFAEQGLEFGEDLLDRIEVGTVGRQEEQLGADGPYRAPNGSAFVAAEIIDDDDVAWLKGRNQELLDIGQEALTIDRPVDHTGRIDAIRSQGGKEGECSPASVRHLRHQPLAARRTSMSACHVGLGPGLVNEDQARRIKPALILLPLDPPSGDVGAILFAGVQAFF
jgi:hypothetical protein